MEGREKGLKKQKEKFQKWGRGCGEIIKFSRFY